VIYLGLKDSLKSWNEKRQAQAVEDRKYYLQELEKAKEQTAARELKARRAKLKAKAERNAMSRSEVVKKNLKGLGKALSALEQPKPVKRTTKRKKKKLSTRRTTKQTNSGSYWDNIL